MECQLGVTEHVVGTPDLTLTVHQLNHLRPSQMQKLCPKANQVLVTLYPQSLPSGHLIMHAPIVHASLNMYLDYNMLLSSCKLL